MITRPKPARFVATARAKAGLSQRELAERSGIPQPTIAAIESGRQRPRFATLDRLIQACGFELDIGRALGEGVDRTLIHAMLRLTPAQRIRRAGRDAAALRPFIGAAARARRGR